MHYETNSLRNYARNERIIRSSGKYKNFKQCTVIASNVFAIALHSFLIDGNRNMMKGPIDRIFIGKYYGAIILYVTIGLSSDRGGFHSSMAVM